MNSQSYSRAKVTFPILKLIFVGMLWGTFFSMQFLSSIDKEQDCSEMLSQTCSEEKSYAPFVLDRLLEKNVLVLKEWINELVIW